MSQDLHHHDQLTPDSAPSCSVLHVGVMESECCWMVMLKGSVCLCRENRYIPTKCALFQTLHQNTAQIMIIYNYNKIWKRCVLKFILYYLDLSSIQSRNKRNRLKNTYELYITNWSYSYKIGIVFAMYHRMRLKGTSWSGLRPILL